MRRILRQWPAAVLATAVLCCGSAGIWGQEYFPTYPATDPGYAAPDASNHLVSAANFNAGEPSLAEEVAELKAWRQEVLEKEAAAKKRAAGGMSVKVGGRVHVDFAAFDQSPSGVAPGTYIGKNHFNGAEFRTSRFVIYGKGFDVIDYKFNWDLAGNAVSAKDVYFTIRELPLLGNVRIGHYKEPFSMEQLMSSNYITFMERSLADTLAPSRHIGVMAFDHTEDENLTWAMGFFASKAGIKGIQADHTAAAVTMRTTWLPWYDEATEGRGLLHTALAYSYRDAWANSFLGDIRPSEAHLGATLDASVGQVDYINQLGGELAFVYGPFSIQSEYIGAYTTRNAGVRHYNINAFYIYASYFLTGESRPYSRSGGTFGRVKPFENFFRVRDCDGCVQSGKGAWEVAYRFSYLDLADGGSGGGTADSQFENHTFGLNWYLNPYVRLMWNLVHSKETDPARGAPYVNAAMMRAQVTF